MRWDTIPGIRITGAGGYGVALKNMFGGGLKFKATFSENGTLSNNIFPALSNLTVYIFKNLGTFSKVFGFTYMYIDLIIKKRKQLIQRTSSHIYYLYFSRYREGSPDFVSRFRTTITMCNEKCI